MCWLSPFLYCILQVHILFPVKQHNFQPWIVSFRHLDRVATDLAKPCRTLPTKKTLPKPCQVSKSRKTLPKPCQNVGNFWICRRVVYYIAFFWRFSPQAMYYLEKKYFHYFLSARHFCPTWFFKLTSVKSAWKAHSKVFESIKSKKSQYSPNLTVSVYIFHENPWFTRARKPCQNEKRPCQTLPKPCQSLKKSCGHPVDGVNHQDMGARHQELLSLSHNNYSFRL